MKKNKRILVWMKKYSQWLIGIILSAVLFILFEVFMQSRDKEFKMGKKVQAISFGSDLIARLDRELNSLIYITSGLDAYIRIQHKNLDSIEISTLLQELHGNSQLIRNFGVAKGFVLKFVEPYKGNEKAIGLDYTKNEVQWPEVKKVVDTKIGTLAGPIELVQGGKALIYRYPVFIEDKYWGLLSTVVNLEQLVENAFKEVKQRGYHFAIRSTFDELKDKIIFGNTELFEKPEVFIMEAKVPNGTWEYAILEKENTFEANLLIITLWIGRIIIFINIFITSYILKVRKRNIENQLKYKLLADNASDVIWIYNVTLDKYTFMSPSISQYGYSVDEVMHMKLLDLVKVDTREFISKVITQLIGEFIRMNNKDTSINELQLSKKDGTSFWAENSNRLRYNEKEELEIIGITRDIEEKKRTQLLLENNEKRLQAIINSTSSGITIIDEDGVEKFTNDAAQQIHGYSKEELLGESFTNGVHPDDIELSYEILQNLINNNKKKIVKELRLIHKVTKEIIWININATQYPKMFNETKRSILAHFQDITKQKENEQELLELNATKDKFFSIIAHDLKNPLGATKQLMDMLVQNYGDFTEEERFETIKDLNKSSNLVYELLENLLQWSRAQRGKLDYYPVNLDISFIVNSCFNLSKAAADKKGIELIKNTTNKDFVFADANMVTTVIRNLITNAIKFTPNQGKIEVNSRLLKDKKFMEISVKDTGIGISKENIQKLLKIDENYTTLGTNEEKGTGLGLILCKEFVEKHGGEIYIDSVVEEGSTFAFTLPVGKSDELSEDDS